MKLVFTNGDTTMHSYILHVVQNNWDAHFYRLGKFYQLYDPELLYHLRYKKTIVFQIEY